MLFAEGDNSPWWVLGAGSMIGAGYGVVKLYVFVRDQIAESKAKREAIASTTRKARTDEQRLAREVAATEAVPVVERLIQEVQKQNLKITEQAGEIRDIQKRERACSEERATDKVILRILVIWARAQENPPPIPDDVLAMYVDGSATHSPLTGGGDS